MLEKMDDFFTARVDGYDEHMRNTIEGASSFYKYTASLLPEKSGAKVLDLGCGTGLELEEYFLFNPFAKITGIDLTEAMLKALKENLADGEFYHYDTPLTVEHEKEALLAAGFTKVEELGDWESTHTLKAVK